jgi:NADPH:quinone reductase-like Zn-dependent oxidoreductase
MVMLSSMMANGRLRPHVGLAVELEAVAEAHRVGESRAHRTGKIVLRVQ